MILSSRILQSQASYQGHLAPKTSVLVQDYRFGTQMFVLVLLGILIGGLLAPEFDISPAEEDRKRRD